MLIWQELPAERFRRFAISAIRAVKQVKLNRDAMSEFGRRSVQITFVEHGSVRQIVLMGKAITVFGMRRASDDCFRELTARGPKRMFSLHPSS